MLLLPYLFIKDEYGMFIAGVMLGLLFSAYFADTKTISELAKKAEGSVHAPVTPPQLLVMVVRPPIYSIL